MRIEVSTRDGKQREPRRFTVESWNEVFAEIGELDIIGVHVRGNQILVFARYA